MKFTERKTEEINDRLFTMKMENPYSKTAAGIGVMLCDSIGGAHIIKDHMVFCDVEELGRLIEELQMLKQAIEEETGLIL